MATGQTALRRSCILALSLLAACGCQALKAGDAKLPPHFVLVAQDNCGNPQEQSHLIAGKNWTSTEEEKQGLEIADPRFLSVAYNDGDQPVVFRYVGLHPGARYVLRVFYYNIQHDRPLRVQTLAADGVELHGPLELPHGQELVRTFELPPALYRDAVVTLSFKKVAGLNAIVSAIELWSDREGLLGPAGSYVRFRVDALPPERAEIAITGLMKIHSSPWQTGGFSLTSAPVREPGYTPWVNLRGLPGSANGSLLLTVPAGARGATQFGVVQDDTAFVREVNWQEPDGADIIVTPDLMDVRTFREQERRYYLHAQELAGGRLHPLTRPPLLFTNNWGFTTGGAAEYMVKSFRLLGLNSVGTGADAAKYEQYYGWGSHEGHYQPPSFLPYDEAQARARYQEHYRAYFAQGRGKDYAPGLNSFQMSDEPGEISPKPEEAAPAFRDWLQRQGLQPQDFGKAAWDEVTPLWQNPGGTLEERRLYYWSRKYRGMLTPKMLALACEAFRQNAPNREVRPYVALSGHSLYMGGSLPLDMFQLAQYPDMTPGISDWMTSGSWWWDSHQSVAFSVAPFNAGARRYGAEHGKPPLSFPMMHCVGPSLFRAYTQLANQCKLISYYNYGPDYNVTEGFWSNSDWARYVVHRINNQAAYVDDILGPGLMRPSRVAMLYAMSTEYWHTANSFADRRATFLALSHEYFQPELVTEEQIANGALAHYDALYVLDICVSAAAQDRIAAWVQGGGLLWACADALARNEYDEQHDLLERMAGLRRNFDKLEAAGLRVEPVAGEAEFEPHAVLPWGRPSAITWEGARVRAVFGDGVPAWLERRVGQGALVYVGHRVGLSYSQRASKRGEFAAWPTSGRQLLTQPLYDAGIRRDLILSEPLVMAMPLSTEHGTVIILFDMTQQRGKPPMQNLQVRLRESKRPVSVQWFDGQPRLVPLPFDYEDGWVTIALAELPWYGNMILVRTSPAPPDDRLAQMRQAADRHLASDDWQALSAAAWTAGFFPDWGMAPRLVPLLEHEHWAVRRSAAEALGRLGYAAGAAAIRAAVDREEDPHALADQVFALAQLGHRDAQALCARLREHPDPFLRREAERITRLLPRPATQER